MSKLEIIDSGCVYRNPNPGYEYTFACHSHLVQLSPSEMLCVYQRGQALYSADSVMVAARSTDGGRTWSDAGLIHDPANDNPVCSYHGPVVTRMSDDTLVIIAMRIDRSEPKQPLFNENTGGIGETDTVLTRSTDNGTHWSALQVLPKPRELVITPSCAVVELSNGRWFQAFDQWHAYDEPGPYRPRTVGLYSDDAGKTWADPVTFADGESAGKGHWHGRIIRLRNDRLFTLFWTGDIKTGGSLPLHRCLGSTNGCNWSTPEPTNLPGQTNWPTELPDGRMVVIYTVRDGPSPGFYAACSDDGGLSWDLDNQIRVWDAAGRDRIGVNSHDSYPRSHDTIAFGVPTSTVMANGDVFCTYWCTEASVTQIRCARLYLDRPSDRLNEPVHDRCQPQET